MIELNIKNFKLPSSFYDLSKLTYPDRPYFQDNQNEIAYLFSSLNPYFNKGKAAYKVIENQTRGIVFYDDELDYEGKKVAYFGYWETQNNLDSNKVLFKDCELWAKNQGAELLIGPINFNTYGKYRLNLTPDDSQPFLNEPYNPNYYPELLESCGFKVLNSYVSYVVSEQTKIQNWYNIYDQKRDLLKFEQYRFEFITPKMWMDNLSEIHRKSELVFGENFSYTPIDFETFQLKYGEFFSRLICPKTSLFVFDKDDEIVGTMINFPNYLDLVRVGLGPADFNLNQYLKTEKNPTLLLKTVGMLKQHTHMGYLLIRMMLEVIPNALEFYDNYVFCLMQEGNYPSKIGKEFSNLTKNYALYVKEL